MAILFGTAIAVPWDRRPACPCPSWDRRPACPALACHKGDPDERAVLKQTIEADRCSIWSRSHPSDAESLHADPDLHRRDAEPGDGADGLVLPARASRNSGPSAKHGRNRVPRCGAEDRTGGTPVLRCGEQDRTGETPVLRRGEQDGTGETPVLRCGEQDGRASSPVVNQVGRLRAPRTPGAGVSDQRSHGWRSACHSE